MKKFMKVPAQVCILPDYRNLSINHHRAWWHWVKRQLKTADAALKDAYRSWRAATRRAELTARFEAAGRHLTNTAKQAAAWLAQKWVEYHQHRPTAFTAIRLGVWG